MRRDFSDYLGEVLALDLMLGAMLEELKTSGELDNTVVILSGDHGIPGVPRGKTNCYDLATRVPMLVRWP
ncbi:MAG: sulfatase-like hydrolase/transferase, partial [Pirellulaceae bacterium]|nr:sulfatase-like hydrolase/transferase [Pirellulaceae bacterium]